MRTRPLRRIGLQVSEISFGCGMMAGLFTREAPDLQHAAMARALELGISHFDTAPVEAALRFVLSNPQVSTALVGFSDIGQIEEAVRCASRGMLSAEEIAVL